MRKADKAGHKPLIEQDRQAYALAISGEGVWDWELSSGRVRHNAQWARLMGLDERQLEHTWQEALACLHEQEREGVMAAIQSCLAGQAAFEYEHRIRHADGSVIWVQNHGEVMARGTDGKPLRMVGSLREVTKQKRETLVMQRRNLFLQTIAAVNEMLMAELPEQELMSRICQELIRDDLFRMAWIGLVDEDGVTVRPVAEAGFGRDYLAQADIRCDDSPQGQGPTGTAIRIGCHSDQRRHREQPAVRAVAGARAGPGLSFIGSDAVAGAWPGGRMRLMCMPPSRMHSGRTR